MKSLKPQERDAILRFLSENASDTVLCIAALDAKKECEALTNDFGAISRYIGLAPYSAKVAKEVPAEEPEAAPAEEDAKPKGKVKPPPGVACTKIGQATKDMLLSRAQKPMKPDDFGRRFLPHLKLLWSRGLLLWDGEFYSAR